jgi:flagellar motor protein MotB
MAEEHQEQHGGGHEEGHGGGGGHKKHHGGHGGHEEHEEGVAEWVVSFADNALLQMGFFVILFAMNLGPKGTSASDNPNATEGGATPQFLDAVISIREGFNNPVSLESKDPADGPLIRRLRERAGMGSNNQDGVPGKNPDQQAIKPSDYNRVTASVQFDQGKSELSGLARQTLQDAARRLRGERFIIEVRGHASAMEAVNGVEDSYRISFARAQATAAALVDAGLRWSQLRVVACGDNERATAIASGLEGHRTNQRAELVVTDETLPPDPHAREQK